MKDNDSKAHAARQRILNHPEAFLAISKDIQLLEDSELELIELVMKNDIWPGQPVKIPENLEGATKVPVASGGWLRADASGGWNLCAEIAKPRVLS